MPVTARSSAARLARAGLIGAVVAAVAACGAASSGPSQTPSSPPASVAVATATAISSPTALPSLTPMPSLTPVPGGQSAVPEPVGTRIPTTETDWGEILDDLPRSFPMFPGADVAEVPDEVVSGSYAAPADVDALVAWYTDAFTERGYAIDTSEPLEDGSRVMDVAADLPECRIQVTFRPAPESTIITVLVASACANGTG